jgi:hypothetical protein
MKQYRFKLHDRATDEVIQVSEWFANTDARDAVVRQSMSKGQYRIEYEEREIDQPNAA